MNNVSLSGRMVKDPELNFSSNGTNYCMFTMAIDRPYKDENGKSQADFIPCVAWRKQAEYIASYIKKGNLFEIKGSIQSRSYTNNNNEFRVVIEVIVDEVKNLTPRPKEEAPAPQEPSNPNYEKNNFDDKELPF